MTPIATLYPTRLRDYQAAQRELALTLGAEKKTWFDVIEEYDSEATSVAFRKEEADRRTIGFRLDALKLQARVAGLEAELRMLDTLLAAGVTHIEGSD